MPELPEVETIRIGLEKYLAGHKITSVEIKSHKTFQGDEKKIIGGEITATRRFGKVLVIDLDNDYSILTHLKLTGQYIYRGPNLPSPKELSSKVTGGVPGPHTLVIFNLDKGGILYYNDLRRFGWIRVVKTSEVETEPFIKKLGPEPFGGSTPSAGSGPSSLTTQGHGPKLLTLNIFRQILSKTSRPAKIVLMDQTKMGGVGNIYANDALWLAAINPRRPANNLQLEEQKKLYNAILSVLKAGIKWGGASDAAYVTPEGKEGLYQKYFLVYGRKGELCLRCKKAKIEKIVLGGRGTYFCPVCQKL